MRYFIMILVILGMVNICYADRVCLEKSTGKLIEYQSGGSTQIDLDVMIQNAINVGYKKENVEAKIVTKQEWEIIKEEQIDKPIREKALQEEQARELIEQKTITKLKALGLTEEEAMALIK